jgi:transcriptional regulator with XRE-family HTH domain
MRNEQPGAQPGKRTSEVALNVRRLMARCGLTLEQVIEASGLSERTVKAVVAGKSKPHARTLHRLAAGLGVSTDELFQNPLLLAHRLFDRRTNPLVDEVVNSRPDLFVGWTEADFDELYSRFGTGGALTSTGATEVIATMNRNRDVHQRVALLLESSHAELLASLVDVLYQKIVVSEP